MNELSSFFGVFSDDLSILTLGAASYCIAFLALGYFFHRFKISEFGFLKFFSSIFSKRHQEEMLLVKKLKEEGIITQEEYEKKISLLKEKSGF